MAHFQRLICFGISALLVLGAGRAWAENCGEQDGFDWRVLDCPTNGGSTGWQPSAEATIEVCRSRYAAQPNRFNVTAVACKTESCTQGVVSFDYCSSQPYDPSTCTLLHIDSMMIAYQKRSAELSEIPCPDCANIASHHRYYQTVDPGFAIVDDLCLTSDMSSGPAGKCEFQKAGIVCGTSGISICAYRYEATGQGCPTEIPQAAGADAIPENWQGVCKGSLCIELPKPAGKNCGVVDGESVCISSIPSGQCRALKSGGYACASGVATPPAPDNGTAGVPATPTATMMEENVVTGTSSTVNYYSSSVVNNSSSPPVGGVDNGAEDGAFGEGDEGGSGSASGSCDIEPSCSGDAIQCAILRQSWMSRCEDGITQGEIEGIIGAPAGVESETVGTDGLSDTVISGGGGSCPAPATFEVFGSEHELRYDGLCNLAVMLRPLVLLLAYVQAGFLVAQGLKG